MAHPLPPELLADMRRLGPLWHHDIRAASQAMLAAWAPLIDAAAPPAWRLHADQSYGPHPRQRLDVYEPTGAAPSPGLLTEGGDGAPVLMFVHGGAFVRGEKCLTPQVYGNVSREFARHGFLAVNVEYRLAPEAVWPAGAEDVRDAVLWVARNAARFGGDARRMVLMAHSAGCAHAATAAWDARVRPPDGLPIVGLVLASPRVDADQHPGNPNAPGVAAYYGTDISLYATRAPIHRTRADAPPTFVGFAQYENPMLEYQSLELVNRLACLARTDGAPMPRVAQYLDHNHTSLAAQFDTPFNAFGADLRDWIGRVLRGDFAGARSSTGRSRGDDRRST